MEVKNTWKVWSGQLQQCVHESSSTGTPMRFSIFIPHGLDAGEKAPMLYYLSGLTCTDENFCQKASNAFEAAAEYKIAIVVPDTSPRGANIPGEDDDYDFGTGAGYYLDATLPPYSSHYRMQSYVMEELLDLVGTNFPVDTTKIGIMGHSMGGHGALTLSMKNPEKFRSVSAFSPICNPTKCPWGIKAFKGYLGENPSLWNEFDATVLLMSRGPFPFKILIDQGTEDNFYKDKQLLPENFDAACRFLNQPAEINMRDGYDHTYYFISTFVKQHVAFHAEFLRE